MAVHPDDVRTAMRMLRTAAKTIGEQADTLEKALNTDDAGDFLAAGEAIGHALMGVVVAAAGIAAVDDPRIRAAVGKPPEERFRAAVLALHDHPVMRGGPPTPSVLN